MADSVEIAQSRLLVQQAEARLQLLRKTMAEVPVGDKYEALGKQLALYMELRLSALRQHRDRLVKHSAGEAVTKH